MKFGRHQFVLSTALFALLLLSCSKAERPKTTRGEAAPRHVRVARAEMRSMERVLRVVGTLSASEEATVAAQVAGQIETNRVDLGSRVVAGQELALIDTTSYDARARQSEAALAKAKHDLDSAMQQLDEGKAALASAKTDAERMAAQKKIDEANARATSARNVSAARPAAPSGGGAPKAKSGPKCQPGDPLCTDL